MSTNFVSWTASDLAAKSSTKCLQIASSKDLPAAGQLPDDSIVSLPLWKLQVATWVAVCPAQSINQSSVKSGVKPSTSSCITDECICIGTNKTRVVPDTDLAGYLANYFAGYRISG